MVQHNQTSELKSDNRTAQKDTFYACGSNTTQNVHSFS